MKQYASHESDLKNIGLITLTPIVQIKHRNLRTASYTRLGKKQLGTQIQKN